MRIEDCYRRDERPEQAVFEFSTSREGALLTQTVYESVGLDHLDHRGVLSLWERIVAKILPYPRDQVKSRLTPVFLPRSDGGSIHPYLHCHVLLE